MLVDRVTAAGHITDATDATDGHSCRMLAGTSTFDRHERIAAFYDLLVIRSLQNHRLRNIANIPTSWAAMKAATLAGAIPANVSDSERAMVAAGLANDVEAVNQ